MKNLKLVCSLAVFGGMVAFAAPASAQAVSAGVDVKVTLASKCRWNGGTTPTGLTVDFGSYTAFGSAKTGTTTNLTFECTRNYAPTPVVSWDTTATNSTAAGVGTVAGLQYALTMTAGTGSPGAAATATSIGSGDTVVFTLGGSMPGGQAGDDQGGAQATDSRTLTVTF
jgi:hypothetical protein